MSLKRTAETYAWACVARQVTEKGTKTKLPPVDNETKGGNAINSKLP